MSPLSNPTIKAVALCREYRVSPKLLAITACALIVFGLAAICEVPPFSNIGSVPGFALCLMGGVVGSIACTLAFEPLPEKSSSNEQLPKKKSPSGDEEVKTHLLSLPNELLVEIVDRLSQEEVIALGTCNRKLRAVSQEAKVWKEPRISSRSLWGYQINPGLSRYGQKIRRLDLSGQHLLSVAGGGLELLESIPKHCPDLQALTFIDCNIYESDYEAWSKMLKGLNQLSALHLAVLSSEDGTLACIVSALANRSDPMRLKYLQLDKMRTSWVNPASNERALQRTKTSTRKAFKRLTGLRVLSLRGSRGVVKVIAPSLSSASQLAELDVSEISIDDSIALMAPLQSLINLRTLMFSGNFQLLDEGEKIATLNQFENAVSNLAQLETLIFRDNGIFGQNAAEALGRALASCTQLKTLDLSANRFPPNEFLITQCIIPKLKDLPIETLMMQNIELDGDEVCGLISDDENIQPSEPGLVGNLALLSHLTSLDLRDNPSIDEEAQTTLVHYLIPGQTAYFGDIE